MTYCFLLTFEIAITQTRYFYKYATVCHTHKILDSSREDYRNASNRIKKYSLECNEA